MARIGSLRLRVVLALLAAVTAAGFAVWRGGPASRLIVIVLNLCMPITASDEVVVQRIIQLCDVDVAGRGLTITINPDRLARDLAAADWRYRLLPPDILNRERALVGAWEPAEYAQTLDASIPFTLLLDPGAGWRPHASLQLPAAEFNRLLSHRFTASLKSREEWVFGHYELTQTPEFDHLTIVSEAEPPEYPITRRRILFSATGRLRVEIEDGPFAAHSTAKVRELKGRCDIDILSDTKGLGFRYRFTIDSLRLSMSNIPPWAERLIAEQLRTSMERSLNREKKRKHMEQHRYPTWFPLDVIINVHLTGAEG